MPLKILDVLENTREGEKQGKRDAKGGRKI
jgi:hypothetical protein